MSSKLIIKGIVLSAVDAAIGLGQSRIQAEYSRRLGQSLSDKGSLTLLIREPALQGNDAVSGDSIQTDELMETMAEAEQRSGVLRISLSAQICLCETIEAMLDEAGHQLHG